MKNAGKNDPAWLLVGTHYRADVVSMNPRIILTGIHFRHNEDFIGQLTQILAGLAIWSFCIYALLKLIIRAYEAGKGDEQRREIEQEIERAANNDPFSTRMGRYRTTFCLRLAVPSAFIIEGFRFGGGWPTILLLCLGGGSWYALSPQRHWMRHS